MNFGSHKTSNITIISKKFQKLARKKKEKEFHKRKKKEFWWKNPLPVYVPNKEIMQQ